MTDIFEDNPGGTPEDTGTKTAEKDLFGELVGEGKKFKTPEDLARGKKQADDFIEQLKQENAEMRERMRSLEEANTKSRTLEEVLNELKQARGGEEGNQSPATSEDILELIDQRLKSHDTTKQRMANRHKATSQLMEKFGNDEAKARDYLKSEAGRLGLSTAQLAELSETSPDAFSRLLNLNPSSRGGGPNIRSEYNTEARIEGKVRNKAYYDNLRKELGQKFYDPDIQVQRFKDAQALGSKFYE